MSRPIEFKTILLACLIISVGQLSMGLVFPSLPWIAKDFDISLDQAQLLVSVYLLGFGPSQFIYVPGIRCIIAQKGAVSWLVDCHARSIDDHLPKPHFHWHGRRSFSARFRHWLLRSVSPSVYS